MAELGRDHIEDGEEFEAAPHTGSQIGRSALWACVALVAMSGAIYAGRSEAGIRRIATAWNLPDATVVPIAQDSYAGAFDVSLARETRRLAATVEGLTAERRQLIARLDNLERSADVTGSIPTGGRAAKGAALPAAVPPAAEALPAAEAAPSTESTTADETSAAASVGTAAKPSPVPPVPVRASGEMAKPASDATGPLEDIFHAPVKVVAPSAAQDFGGEPSVYSTEFGLDLGGAVTLEALRGLWLTLKVRHAGLFDGLRPVVAVREGRAGVELRLVAGPLSNAAAATRLCVALTDAHCKAVVFDGQRLAMR